MDLDAKPHPFVYLPLHSRKCIRLLKIFPATTDAELLFELSEVSLDDRPVRRYKALSYTWGGPERHQKIYNHDSSSYIRVTENLFAALQHLRRKFRPSDFFWIDAICINQDDIDERSAQVPLMSDIYQKAEKVIVWLQDAAQPPPVNQSEWTIVRKPAPPSLGPDATSKLRVNPVHRLNAFHGPWFMRVWILQEIAFATNIVVTTGQRMLPWDEVVEIASEYLDRDREDERNTPVNEAVEENMAMFCNSSEPKDKIFALLSLASDVDVDAFAPDYRLPWPKICVQVARHSISQCNTLDCLRSVGLGPRSANLPTWVADLSQQRLYCPLNTFSVATSALEGSHDVTKYCSESVMQVKCLLLQTVEIVGTPCTAESSSNWTLSALLKCLDDWYEIARYHERYENDARLRINTFWGTMAMTLESDATHEHIYKVYNEGEGWHWHFRKLLGQDVGDSQPEDAYDFDNEPPLDDENIFSEEVNPNLYTGFAKHVMFDKISTLAFGRRFATTYDGYMALLPADTREEDKICTIYGCRVPFVVRPCEDGWHELVGAAYLHCKLNWDKFESLKTWEQLQWITFR